MCGKPQHKRSRPSKRRGVVLILVTILFMCLVGILAMAVDVGYLYNVKSDLQTAVDAAALAGAGGLSVDPDTARARAVDLALKNYADGHAVSLADTDIELGYWSSGSGFEAVNSPGARPNAIQVTAQLNQDRGTQVQYFLARALGFDSSDVTASAVAVYGAREIVLSIDLSASMSYDSQLRHVQLLGKSAVEQSLRDIWHDLRTDPESPLHMLDGSQMIRESIRITSTDYSRLIKDLGLSGVPYPFPPCTWKDYFDYVQRRSNSRNEGKSVPLSFRNYYGYLTLMDYLQAVQYRYARDHVSLWQTEQQPVTAVKDAIAVFLAYMNTMRTDDRIGLVSYSLDDFNAKLETHLTDDYELVESTMRHKQAGHYHNETNIAAGIEAALDELLQNGREGTSRLIVLLSDGKATRPNSDSYGRALALKRADQAAENYIPIMTISLGSAADTHLMQEIADRTKGVHFVIPGGHSVSEYEDQLNEVFLQIARDRPLSLVD